MSGTIKKDPSDERGGSGGIEEKECIDGACPCFGNAPAQSEREKGGPIYPSAPGGDD